MGECINKYYILNDKVKNTEEFVDEFVLSSKCIYEVIRIIDGKPLFLNRHLNRFHNSIRITNLDLIIHDYEIIERLNKLLHENCCNLGNVKIVLTEDLILLYFIKHSYLEKEVYNQGVHTIFFKKTRKNPNAKVIDYGFRKQVNEEIRKKKAYEAILLDNEDNITEGSRSNIFMIQDRKIITAPVENVLPGVTRDVIIDICNRNGLEIYEEKVNYLDIKKMDAIFISGTSPKILPVKSIGESVFDSSNNIIVKKIMQLYDEECFKDLGSLK